MCPLPFFSCYLFKLYLLSFPLKFLFDHRVIVVPSVFLFFFHYCLFAHSYSFGFSLFSDLFENTN